MTAPAEIRVLHLCEHFGNHEASFHGVARSFELWLPELDRPPFRVWLCSRAKPSAAALERYRRAGIEPLSLGYGKLDPRSLKKLLRICRELRIGILHLHGYGSCTWGRIAARILGIPAIVHERCNYGTVPWFQRPVERLLAPWTDLAFAVSESTRRFTIDKRYLPADKVKLLYSGIPLDRIPPPDPDASARLRAEHGADNNTFLMGIAGRLEPHKGHADVFEALAAIASADASALGDWRLWVVGDGYHQAALADRARALGLADRIEFAGYQSDIWPWIRALDLQIFPSHREGTPNTLYEAMAAGNAILASTADGQGEILTDGRDALLYAPGDTAALRDRLLRLRADPSLRAALAAGASARIRDFDMARTMDTLRQTYLALASRRTP
ncbi:MAG: glycosyltransferase [Kiritimatiellae bacterium]|nr:glycosyltransferase [Kiritimatiellia bacterium]